MRFVSLLALLLLTGAVSATGQLGADGAAAAPATETAPSLQAQLGSLLAAQQAAVATNDPAQIVAASKPAAALALRLVAMLDLVAGQTAPARELLVRSAGLAPKPGTALLLLTADLDAAKPDAIAPRVDADVAAVLALTGDTAAAHLLLSHTFEAAGDLRREIAELERALVLDPNLPSAHLLLGAAYWQLNEFQYNPDSLREFALAQQADPAGFLANLDLASLLSQYHRFPEAAKYLALAAAANPASSDPSFQLGMNAYSEGDYAAARPALERAVALTGIDTGHNGFQIRRALAALSRIAAVAGHPAEAERYDAEAEALHQQLLAAGYAPTLSESSLMVGAGASHAVPRQPGKSVLATAAVTVPHRENDGAERPAAALAGASAADGGALRQQLLTVAASALNDAGTALARSRDFAGALPLFREAAATDPTLSPVLRNLGLAAFHTNDLSEAKDAFTRALQLDPNDALARRYLDQISQP